MKTSLKTNPRQLSRIYLCSWSTCLRMAAAATILTLGPPPTKAGSLSTLSTLESTTAPSLNNDDYVSAFTDNANKATFNSNTVPVLSGTISNLEGIFAVLDSSGTTEYALTIKGAYNSAVDPPLTAGYQLQLGFGKGSSFVPASTVFPGLDFDFPLPANPALPATISLFGITTLFDLQSHGPDTIVWSGHSFNGSFFHTSLFRLPLDVPDLPANVMDYYLPGDLPPDFPVGAKAFTIQGRFVPEPSTLLLTALLAVSIFLLSRQHSSTSAPH